MHARENLQQHVDAFARDRAADVQEIDSAAAGLGTIGEQRVHPGFDGRFRRRGQLGPQAEAHDAGALGWDESARQQFVARCGAVAADVRRLLQTCEDAPGHRAEQPAAPAAGRFPETAESVQVVAGDDGASRRQSVDELTVRVVSEMEQREGGALRAQEARVVVEAVNEPVQTPEPAACPAEAPPHGRAKKLDL